MFSELLSHRVFPFRRYLFLFSQIQSRCRFIPFKVEHETSFFFFRLLYLKIFSLLCSMSHIKEIWKGVRNGKVVAALKEKLRLYLTLSLSTPFESKVRSLKRKRKKRLSSLPQDDKLKDSGLWRDRKGSLPSWEKETDEETWNEVASRFCKNCPEVFVGRRTITYIVKIIVCFKFGRNSSPFAFGNAQNMFPKKFYSEKNKILLIAFIF